MMKNLPNIKCLSCDFYNGIVEIGKMRTSVKCDYFIEENGFTIEKGWNGTVSVNNFFMECTAYIKKGKRINLLK